MHGALGDEDQGQKVRTFAVLVSYRTKAPKVVHRGSCPKRLPVRNFFHGAAFRCRLCFNVQLMAVLHSSLRTGVGSGPERTVSLLDRTGRDHC
jgi:hypothetical protein